MSVEFWAMGRPNAGGPNSQEFNAVRQAVRAEEIGCDGIVYVDSQNRYGDTYVAMAPAAHATSTVKLGTGVTNSYTRHPRGHCVGQCHGAGGEQRTGIPGHRQGRLGAGPPGPRARLRPQVRELPREAPGIPSRGGSPFRSLGRHRLHRHGGLQGLQSHILDR